MAEKEIWKDIPNYEGYYQASNLGRVRSLDRTVIDKIERRSFHKGRDLKWCSNKGYRKVVLSKDGICECVKISQLVAISFLNHTPNGNTNVVDHINGVRSDDRLINLRIVTNRQNVSTCFRSNDGTFSSKHIGVYWHTITNNWRAQIRHKGVLSNIGFYDNEIDASNAYQKALSKIKDGSFDANDYKAKFSSKYKGVRLDKKSKKWRSEIRINGKSKHIGVFSTEIEAHRAYQDKLKTI